MLDADVDVIEYEKGKEREASTDEDDACGLYMTLIVEGNLFSVMTFFSLLR